MYLWAYEYTSQVVHFEPTNTVSNRAFRASSQIVHYEPTNLQSSMNTRINSAFWSKSTVVMQMLWWDGDFRCAVMWLPGDSASLVWCNATDFYVATFVQFERPDLVHLQKELVENLHDIAILTFAIDSTIITWNRFFFVENLGWAPLDRDQFTISPARVHR